MTKPFVYHSPCWKPSPTCKDGLASAAPTESNGSPSPIPVMFFAPTLAPATAPAVALSLDNKLFKQFMKAYFEAQVPAQTKIDLDSRK